jgi:hypothetical protein
LNSRSEHLFNLAAAPQIRQYDPVDVLAAAARAVVRAAVDGGPGTVIVKAHEPGFADHWMRESAAPGAEALTELRSATAALGPDADALTPADACPDNNVATPAGLVLLDFEQATMRHVAWDAAYLLVPWPSCWCSWRIPADVAGVALARWRAAVAPTVPVVGSAAFDRDLDVAVAAWAFLSSAWFLAGAVDEEDGAPGDALRGPTRRAVIRYRMRLAARRRTVLPALADLAEEILAATAQRWGDLRLRTAPAYRGRLPVGDGDAAGLQGPELADRDG